MNPLDSCRVMFVLGAGASTPLGMPTTVSLMKRLEGQTRLGRFAAEIHESAAYRFRISADSINIEDFFEHLYELQLLLWLARRSELPTVLPGFTANAPVLEQAGTLERWTREGLVPYIRLPQRGRWSGARFSRNQLLRWLRQRTVRAR